MPDGLPKGDNMRIAEASEPHPRMGYESCLGTPVSYPNPELSNRLKSKKLRFYKVDNRWCRGLRRTKLGGRPIPFHLRLGNGSWPGGHTLTED